MASAEHFVLEHPKGAPSWEHAFAKHILEKGGVSTLAFGQCRTGLVCPGTTAAWTHLEDANAAACDSGWLIGPIANAATAVAEKAGISVIAAVVRGWRTAAACEANQAA